MPQSTGNKMTKLVRSCAIHDDDYETDDNVTNVTTVILPTTVTLSITTTTVVTSSETLTVSVSESSASVTTTTIYNHQQHYQKQYSQSYHHSKTPTTVKTASDTREYQPPAPLTHEQFIEFLCHAINKIERDQLFLLFVEKELVTFTKDPLQIEYHIEEISSYYRLLIHRCAEFFGMEHNLVRNTSRIVIRKTNKTQLPDLQFSSFIRDQYSLAMDSFQNNNFKLFKKNYSMDTNNNEKMSIEMPKRVLLKRSEDGSSNGGSRNSSYDDTIVSKETVYYEQQPMVQEQQQQQQQQQQSQEPIQDTQQSIDVSVSDNSNSVDFDAKNRNLSFEEREEQYDKARRRIFDSTTTNDWVTNVEDTEWNDHCQVRVLKEETSTAKSDNYTNGTVSLLTRTSTTDSTNSSVGNGIQIASRLSPSASSGYKSITQSQHSESYTPSPTTMISLEMSNNECTDSRSTSDEPVYMRVNAADEEDWNNKVDEDHENLQNNLVQIQQLQKPIAGQDLTQYNNVDYVNYPTNYMMGLPKVDVIPPGSIIINPNTGTPFVNSDGTMYYYDPSNIPEFLISAMFSTRTSQSIPIYSHQQELTSSAQKMISSNNIPQSTDTTHIPIVSAVTTNPYAYNNYQDSINNNGQTLSNLDYNLQLPQQHYVSVPYYYANDATDLNANALAYNYVPMPAQYLLPNQMPLKDYQVINSENVIDLSSQFSGMNLTSQQLPVVSSNSPSLTQTTESNSSSIVATTAVKYPNLNNQVPATYYTQIQNQQTSNDGIYVTKSAGQTTNTVSSGQDISAQQQYSVISSQTNQTPAMNTTTTQGPQFVFYQPRPQVPMNYQQLLYNCGSPIQPFTTVVNPYLQSLQHPKHKMYPMNSAASYNQMPKTPHPANVAVAFAAAAAAAAASSNIQMNQPTATFYNRNNWLTSSNTHHHGRGYNSRPGYRNTRSFHQYSSRQYHQTMGGRMATNIISSDTVANVNTENGNFFYTTFGSGHISKSITNKTGMRKFNSTFRHNGDNFNANSRNSASALSSIGGTKHDDNAENNNNTADKRYN